MGVNLTTNTPVAVQAAVPSSVPATQSRVITIQSTQATTSQTSAFVPVTGGCSNPYTVQSGDSLSQIAVNCNTTLAAIRQANRQIINANLIYPGQQVNIPNGNIGQIPVTGKEEAIPVTSLPLTCACDSAPIPVTGFVPMLIPGSSLQVRAINFQPNTPVNVAIGPKNTTYTVVAHGVTDASGKLTTSIIVPTVSNSQTLWVVVVETTTQPSIRAMSLMFNIDP
jgi:LysM repeat protein